MAKPPRPPQQPDGVRQTRDRAVGLHQQGRLAEAEQLYRQILAAQPVDFDALHLLGMIKLQQRNDAEAVSLISAALRAEPNVVEALSHLGTALANLNRFEEALGNYDKALALRPDDAVTLFNRGVALANLNRYAEAVASYQKSLTITPGNAAVHYNLGAALRMLHRYPEALACFDRALAIRPDNASAHYGRGTVLHMLHRYPEALASFDRALAIRPDFAEALYNRGSTLRNLGRDVEALSNYDQALAIRPDFADALYNRGHALKQLKRFDEALQSFDKAAAVQPDHPDAYEAAEVVLALCDWKRTAEVAGELSAQVAAGKSPVNPFVFLGFCDDPALQLQCAKSYIKQRMAAASELLANGAAYRHDKIRLAYLSADFHEHATAYLIADLFEQHDRSRFEVLGISFGPDDGSEMRRRLAQSFDQFHDVRTASDRDAAKLLKDLEADIAIDLKGHTQDARPQILGFRPAPVQVNYLGYPGTMGAGFIDYIIADPTVAPFEQQACYTEKIVHLPDCYQPNSSKRKLAERMPTRREAGLPDDSFVFCCFNNNYKITPPVFDVWMRLLRNVPGSVLWLLQDNAGAERNLRREAEARGIDPARLIFAERRPLDQHLSRHRLADLFLDTLPYNAHTTASDALWVGLPVLTRLGKCFAGRVAASLLGAVGLPELVTHSLEDYEALALKLATDPALLQAVRSKLEQNRLSYPLFDSDRFRRHMEAAYTAMYEVSQREEAPRSFAVPGV
jgi:predicted O-linked N-acetylglucosamine transferase (SPINDLY family)